MAMVDVDDSRLPTGGLTAQVDWLGLRVGSHLALSHTAQCVYTVLSQRYVVVSV